MLTLQTGTLRSLWYTPFTLSLLEYRARGSYYKNDGPDITCMRWLYVYCYMSLHICSDVNPGLAPAVNCV